MVTVFWGDQGSGFSVLKSGLRGGEVGRVGGLEWGHSRDVGTVIMCGSKGGIVESEVVLVRVWSWSGRGLKASVVYAGLTILFPPISGSNLCCRWW